MLECLDVEALLTIYDAVDPFLKTARTAEPKLSEDSDSETEERMRSRGRRRNGVTVRDEDDSDELDL